MAKLAADAILVPGETNLVVPACPPSFNSFVVPRKWLHRFVDAIAWFWDDVEYVHCNSLPPPNEGAQKRANELRLAREARPAR